MKLYVLHSSGLDVDKEPVEATEGVFDTMAMAQATAAKLDAASKLLNPPQYSVHVMDLNGTAVHEVHLRYSSGRWELCPIARRA